MKSLVLGASGATGKLVVSKLIENDIAVKALIRNTALFPAELSDSDKVEIAKGSIDELTVSQISALLADSDAVEGIVASACGQCRGRRVAGCRQETPKPDF